MANKSALDRVREICLALPEATEKPFGGHTDPTWRVPDKIFAMYSDNHHGDGRVSQCKAPPGAQEVLTGADPQRFFIPPYVGHIAGSVYDSTSGRSIGMSSQPSSMTATG